MVALVDDDLTLPGSKQFVNLAFASVFRGVVDTLISNDTIMF